MAQEQPSSSKSVIKLVDELRELVVTYFRQEAVEPLKGLGRFLAWGLAGSLLIAIGSVILLIGVLRVLQEETGPHLTGSWSWAPYAITLVVSLMVIGLAVSRIGKGPGKGKR